MNIGPGPFNPNTHKPSTSISLDKRPSENDDTKSVKTSKSLASSRSLFGKGHQAIFGPDAKLRQNGLIQQVKNWEPNSDHLNNRKQNNFSKLQNLMQYANTQRKNFMPSESKPDMTLLSESARQQLR
jgi:hypothetical protein